MFEKLKQRFSIGDDSQRSHVPIQEMVNNLNVYRVGLGLNGYITSGIDEAYNKCAPISICINKTANYTSKGEPIEYDLRGVKIENSEIVKKLNNPNDFQTKNEFINNVVCNVRKYGVAYIYIKYENTSDAYKLDKSSIVVLENEFLLLKKPYLSQFEKYKNNEPIFTYNDLVISFDVINSQLIPIFDTYNKNPFEGKSRISEIIHNVSNYIAANDGERIIAGHPGGVGIISRSNSDNNFIDTSDKSLEDQFNKDGGTGKAKSFWRFFSIPLQKLNLLEPYQNFGFDKIKIDAESIARKAFDVPAEIYGEANSKYENLSAAEKMFITNTCQPLLDIIFSSIAKYYDKKIIIKSDFSFMPCFAVDKKDAALELKTIAETIKILTDAGKQAEADLLTKKYFV